MATATATTTICSSPIPTICRSSTQRKPRVQFVTGLNAFGGLKAQNAAVSSLGLPICADRSFARIVSSLKKMPPRGGGGALAARCNAAVEIFNIAAIMNGLTLVGVAVGFVLLRIEAFVEEE